MVCGMARSTVRAPVRQALTHYDNFDVHPPLPERVRERRRALAGSDRRGINPEDRRFTIMRKQSDQQSQSSAELQLWTHDAALKLVPYLRAVVRSLRDHWLHIQSVRAQIQRLNSRPGRPDRQTLILRAMAARELDQAHI